MIKLWFISNILSTNQNKSVSSYEALVKTSL